MADELNFWLSLQKPETPSERKPSYERNDVKLDCEWKTWALAGNRNSHLLLVCHSNLSPGQVIPWIRICKVEVLSERTLSLVTLCSSAYLSSTATVAQRGQWSLFYHFTTASVRTWHFPSSKDSTLAEGGWNVAGAAISGENNHNPVKWDWEGKRKIRGRYQPCVIRQDTSRNT